MSLHDYHVVCSIHSSELPNIRLSDKFGLRLNFCLGYSLFLIFYLNQIRIFFIISWLRHVFTITYVIIIYTKNFFKYLSLRSEEGNTCKTDRPLQPRGKMNCQGCKTYNKAAEQVAAEQLSDNFGLRLNFGLGHALLLIFYLNQIRNFYYFLF